MRSLDKAFAVLSLVFGGWTQTAHLASEIAIGEDAIESSQSHVGQIAPIHDLTETIVSALSASNQHTIFLRLLQRSKCIPLLAHIGNATVFAPTDEAWTEWFNRNMPEEGLYLGWVDSSLVQEIYSDQEERDRQEILDSVLDGEEEEEDVGLLDNQNWALRQHLLYHMLNYTLPPSAFIADHSSNITIETSLLFPLSAEPELPPTPPPGPPWLPRGGEGLLGGHGQRLRLGKGGSEQGGERGRAGVDHVGEGGVDIWDGSGWPKAPKNGSLTGFMGSRKEKKTDGARWTRNGVVVGLQGVLEPPPSIETIIKTRPELSYLAQLLSDSPLPSPLPDNLTDSPHLTFFAPSNKAFEGVFDDVERRYLEGEFGAEGVARIVSGSVVLGVQKDGVGWSDHWGKKEYQVESASGLDLVVEVSDDGSLRVNGTEATTVDIFASNGVIQILPKLLLPPNFRLLNSAEKVLLSVNATRFVSLLRSANLSSTYIGAPKDQEAWTILAPTDEVLDVMDKWGDTHQTLQSRSFEDVSPIAALLQYHILPGRLSPKDIHDGMLVGTELRISALKGGRQRLKVDVSDHLDRTNWDNIGRGEIRFGGSTVLGKPIRSGKSIIYLLSSLLSPPDDVLQTAVSNLQLSTFIAAVYAADLDRIVKRTPGVTYFIPRNRAFGSLGLSMNYLLLPEGKDELRKVIRYHAVDGIIYSSDVESGRTKYKTLSGGEVILTQTNGSLALSSPTKWEGHDSGENLPANGELRPAHVALTDALTSTGVIHTIDSVMIPADVSITISKLIRGSKYTTMGELMIRAGLGWILEGREPTSDEVSHAILQGIVRSQGTDDDTSETPDVESLAMPSYTVLVPTDKAFSQVNLTKYTESREALLDLLKLHIIPTQPTTPRFDQSKQPASPPKDGQPLSIGDDLVYSTLLSSTSKYGDVAFRATGDNSFIVGIKGAARSGKASMGDSARVGEYGRASVRWRKSVDRPTGLHVKKGKGRKEVEKPGAGSDVPDDANLELWRGGLTLGGGVLVIDSVLIPYEPSWFNRWGWLVIMLVGVGAVLLIAGGSVGWWWITKRKREEMEYEPLEGEEEE